MPHFVALSMGQDPRFSVSSPVYTGTCGRNHRACGGICFTHAAEISLHSDCLSEPFSGERRATSRPSSTKSMNRNGARPCPKTTSGSGETMSVHCGGTEHMAPSSTCSKSRLPDRLWRSPTQTSCRPLNGWKGWVMWTRCAEAAAMSAFRVGLQAVGERPLHLAVTGRRRGGDFASSVGLHAGRDRLAQPAPHLPSEKRWIGGAAFIFRESSA